MLRQAFLEDPALQNFVGDLHQNKIRQFVELDQELLMLNRDRIAHHLSEHRPNVYTNLTPSSELGILLSELNRKRRHMPIRKLLLAAGGLIQTIKPCFMMSPLSIAQFLDPHGVPNLSFDVVIFDEASQVKPEDALGALLRGRQLVVMGDTKQLPPTTFFDIIIHPLSEEDYELDSLMDMESILHLCKRSFPIKMLRWHYRSRHESLIAVSNQEFYNNHLFVYPSPCHSSEQLGLMYMPLDRDIATYDRGRTSTNLEEAKAVVQAAFDHFQKYGDGKSLGIGTFNVNQQQAILEVLELELKRHPRAQKFHKHFFGEWEEKFFVKNLETIQGDERDVIFVSVGYGFDEDGKLTHNFGPLNKDGGERRLNVLVTRAKEKCMVFANFHAGDLKNVTEGSAFGLRALKTFLGYAEHRNLESMDSHLVETTSPFEDSIRSAIKEEGLEVHQQVGCAGYRLDLAVVDPEDPDRYLLGIECDGAMYHSAPVARDRDRLRQQILEGLGWNIYRIWSTDWYRNREESINRLFMAIQEAREGKKKPEVELIEEETLVEEEAPPVQVEVNLEDMIPAYQLCNDLELSKDKPLHEKLPQEVAPAMRRVVDTEGPIHVTELYKRIRSHWGLKRSGRRIKETLDASLQLALDKGLFTSQDDFLFSPTGEVRVRRRGENMPARIELISDEEIKRAVLLVIETQYATYPEELVTQVARLFGFKSTRQATRDRVNHILRGYLEQGELVAMPNGMINFPRLD
jgi:very-short-patch-repair endonuclease